MRRRAVLLITAMAAVLVVACGVALAANISCKAGTTCFGTNKADTMTGTNQADDMRGRGGGDTIHGRDGDDKALGGDGNDDIYAGLGNDSFVAGEAGDDSYVFEERWGADTVTNGEDSGEDKLVFSSITGPLDIDLIPGDGRDEVFSNAGMLNFPGRF